MIEEDCDVNWIVDMLCGELFDDGRTYPDLCEVSVESKKELIAAFDRVAKAATAFLMTIISIVVILCCMCICTYCGYKSWKKK